jgi:4'-phosphopantetheinyl transferase
MLERNEPWLIPPAAPTISSGDVDVWRILLDQPVAVVEKLERVINAEELHRADLFYLRSDRSRFIVGRGSLRSILGIYLAKEPDQLAFHYGEHGKPALAEGGEQVSLQFNIAHSYDVAVLAVAHSRRVGIDLERICSMSDADRIAARFFSEHERSFLQALPNAHKLEAFFRCWTCKEAYLKATGEGLSFPLDRFDISLVQGSPPCLVRVEGRPQESALWQFREIVIAPDNLAVVAVEGSGWRLRCFDFSASA